MPRRAARPSSTGARRHRQVHRPRAQCGRAAQPPLLRERQQRARPRRPEPDDGQAARRQLRQRLHPRRRPRGLRLRPPGRLVGHPRVDDDAPDDGRDLHGHGLQGRPRHPLPERAGLRLRRAHGSREQHRLLPIGRRQALDDGQGRDRGAVRTDGPRAIELRRARPGAGRPDAHCGRLRRAGRLGRRRPRSGHTGRPQRRAPDRA